MVQTEEERKENRRKYQQKYRQTEAYKESRKKGEVNRKKYFSSEQYKKKKKEYWQKEGKTVRRKYFSKPEVWKNTQVVAKKYRDTARLEVLQYYSKRLSNSDIPCCRCCGLNDYLEFLSLDHIPGAKIMDKIPELIDLGYSSELRNIPLYKWIKKNNYLSNLQTEYFQILCHNCNLAKGHSKDNKCPHEK
jgi:hypothetical protein|tara:strand:- start:119 stop:688 length:570 start_codon:yes stop_codon:yes gene_type:complete